MKSVHILKTTLSHTGAKIGSAVNKNFVFATLNFIYIFVFIQVFGLVFGGENTVVAIILSILMGIYAGRDVSASPLRQFLTHTFVLAALCTSACFSVSLGPWIAIPINLVTTFCILYAYTYDYANHLYFPYILSYLFLIYISPVAPVRLPFRLLSVAAGTFVMLLYALILRPRNIVRPAKNAVSRLLSMSAGAAELIRDKGVTVDLTEEARALICELSRNADARRNGARQLSAAAVKLIDVGRAAENLIILFADRKCTDERYADVWNAAIRTLGDCRTYAERRTDFIPLPAADIFRVDELTEYLYRSLIFLREKLLRIYGKSEETSDAARPTIKTRLRALTAYSPMKLAYALRTALLLTAFMIPVQYFALPHGKWLLFTIASVSLPYADDVRRKGQKRLLATLIGGTVATVCFALIPNAYARTAIMMLSGYLSFYFAGYTGNYACATVGALGGAVAGGISGWAGVAGIFALRLAYIALGVIVAYVFNLALFPYRRRRASSTLFEQYAETVRRLCELDIAAIPDEQTYYDLVVKNNLLEVKLLKNSEAAGKRTEMSAVIADSRSRIRLAHQRVQRMNAA